MTIGIDPNIGYIGSLAVEWHGVFMALGIIIGLVLTLYLAHRDDFPTEHFFPAVVWGVVGGLIGARITHVIDEWELYQHHFTEVFAIWNGGLGWYGGLIGGVLAGIIYCWAKHVSAGAMLDKSAAGLMLGLAVGRIGCTINGDAAGTRTSSSWGLVYTNPDSFAPLNVLTQPAPIYEILCLIVVVGVLIWLRRRVRPEWSLFLIMLALYSFGRFFISWVRDEPAVLGPLHQSHVISIVLFVVAVALLIYRGVHFVEGSSSEPEDEAGVDAS